MSTAVIGANGFLGEELVKQLLKRKKEVIAVYNKNKGKIPDQAYKCSIEEFCERKIAPEYIIFSAGSFRNSRRQNITLICELLYKLTQNFRESRFLYVSSANVYGDHAEVVTETSSFNSIEDYGKSKLAGEFIVSGLDNFSIVRLVYLYGKGLDNGSFLPFVIGKAKEGKIPLYGEGERMQDYLHVSDAAALCLKALYHNSSDIYLGASGRSLSNLAVAELVTEEIGDICEIEFVAQPEEAKSLYYDPSWTCKQLDWMPRILLEEGMKEMLI